jgi:DinB superfamily
MAATDSKTVIARGLHPSVLTRIVEEGYGPGAWHGPDLRAALRDVTPEVAFERPAPERHNIAEVTMHHAWSVRSVIGQLIGRPPGPFPLDGEDWFRLTGSSGPTWMDILTTLQTHQKQLGAAVAHLGSHPTVSPLPEAERFDLVLGITCHAVYHAGQVQLIKRLLSA